MKTTILQSLFKIALLLFGMVVGVGCDDSDNPDNRIQEGIEISGILAKTVENGTEIIGFLGENIGVVPEIPNGDNPLLDLKKRSHIRRRCRVQQHQRRLQIQCRQWAIQNRRFDSD